MTSMGNLFAMLAAETEHPYLLALAACIATPFIWWWGYQMFRGMRTDPEDTFFFDLPLVLVPPWWLMRLLGFLAGAVAMLVGSYRLFAWILSIAG